MIENIPIEVNVRVVISLVLALFFLSFRWLITRFISRHAEKNEFAVTRKLYVIKLASLFFVLIFFTLLALVWEVTFEGLSLYFTSFFAVVGVGLFATWSIISNITAAVILFFNFPFRIGSHIHIIDGDNSIQGIIIDITMFSTRIKMKTGEIVVYPNNLMLQKPIQMLE
ncbi:MAG: mechanosensitive ion channel family protein [Cyclobacteriaceae bacterium]|nr:mechanosensitive ion channel family protein [Cyclobacteriaceae bacterium]